MSHDRGCWKCGRDIWEYDRCTEPQCAKAGVREAMDHISGKLAENMAETPPGIIQPKVYVLQQHLYKNPATRIIEPKFDLTPATRFGEIDFILKPDDQPGSHDEKLMRKLHDKLSHYRSVDYLLPIGSTVLIAMMGAVASEYSATLNFLYWSGKDRNYRVTTFDVGAPEN